VNARLLGAAAAGGMTAADLASLLCTVSATTTIVIIINHHHHLHTKTDYRDKSHTDDDARPKSLHKLHYNIIRNTTNSNCQQAAVYHDMV